MRTDLSKRVTELERVVDATTSARERDKRGREIFPGDVHSLLTFNRYDTWRHQCLSLEERLAIARDDYAFSKEITGLDSTRGYWQTDEGKWVDFWCGAAAREIETRILEREGKIDDTEANALRDNSRSS